MATASPTKHRHRVDALFLEQFHEHVGRSLVCCCNLEGPDRSCDLGTALHNLATKGDWEERKTDFLRRGRTGSP